MKNDISTEERIDNYILGNMTAEERARFESDTQADSELRQEYESQLEVANGVQRVALRQFLSECEENRGKYLYAKNSKLLQVLKNSLGNVIAVMTSDRKFAWSLSAVAAIIIAVVGFFNYSGMSHALHTYSVLAYNQISVSEPRDGNEVDLLLASAYASIGAEQLDLAEFQLEQANDLIESGLNTDVLSEEDEYNHQLLLLKREDLRWYSAILLMKQGKVLKARKALSAIIDGKGNYAKNAQDAFNEIYHSK